MNKNQGKQHLSQLQDKASPKRQNKAFKESVVATRVSRQKSTAYQSQPGRLDAVSHESRSELEKFRDRYEDLYQNSRIGYITLTGGDLISEINMAGANMLGEGRNELLNRHFASFVVQQDKNLWNKQFSDAQQSGQEDSFELILQRRDGSRLHVQVDSLQKYLEGGVPYMHMSLTDTSRRHRLQESEHRLRNALDNTRDMILIFSPDNLRFNYANKGAIHSIGYSREELMKMSPLDVLLLIPEPECRSFISPLATGKRIIRRFETMAFRKDGSKFPVEAQLQFVKDEDYKDQGMFIAVVRDITKRKFAERELRRQKNLMWKVIDTDPNMIFVKDAQGIFLLANQAVADYYELAIKDVIGKGNAELNHNPDEVAKFRAADQEVIEKKIEVVVTERLVKDGKSRWLQTVKRPLIQDDGSVNVLGIGVDITEIKTVANKLTDSYKELQRLALHLENIRSEERVQIARDLHDEMGAILAALKMRVGWLKSKLPEGFPKITTELEIVSDLVTQGVRTMHRVVADLRPNLLDDIGLFDAIRDYLKRFKEDTGIDCQYSIPAGINLEDSQSNTIFRIFQESLNNVAKHSKASKIDVNIKQLGESITLQIKDNGVGFDTAAKLHSYGLLGIKERALMIGGEATISSMPSHGTLVRVIIPVTSPIL